jgi:lipopolysaccharide heptosyltransferase III
VIEIGGEAGDRRTVVLHPGALGDVLLAIPALRALRADRPGDAMVLAAQPRIGRLLASLGVVDRSLDFDALGLHTLFTEHAPGEPSRRLIAGARVVSWFGSRDAGFARRLRSLAPESVVASSVPADGLTVWEHLLASVAPVSAGVAGAQARRESIALDADVVDAGRRALTGAGWDGVRPLVILHPGAGGVAKRWAVEGFALLAEAVADALGGEIVVHEGPADRDAVASLFARLRVPARALVDPPLETLAGAVHHAALWVGNDSGVSHLAAAVGTPTLALFVAANLAWRPWAPAARVRVVGVDTFARSDVDAVIADASDLLRPRAQRVSLARGGA